MLTRLLFLLLLFVSGISSASLLSQQRLPAQYMQTTEDAAIWAQVGNDVVNVGNVRAGQILAVVPAAADYYEFRFGFGTGFIDKEHLEPVQGKMRVEDGLGDLNKPCLLYTSPS
ncbi:polysaccharide deacetylase family protein, partial [Enterobacter sp. 63]